MNFSEDYFKLIVFCAGFGGAAIYQAIKRQKRIRHIEDTPKSKIASAPQGLVEVQGFAWPQDKSHTSNAGHELVYYHFALQREEQKGSGKNKRREWVTIFSFVHNKPFYLMDPTGLALIDPTGSDLEIESPNNRMWTNLKEAEKAYYLEKVIGSAVPNFPPKGRFFGLFSQRYRVSEKEIRAGCPVYVTGDFRTNNVNLAKVQSQGLTHFANRVIDFNSRALKNLKGLLDKDNDGKVCHKEARDGYSFAAQLSKKKSISEKLVENEFDVHGEMRSSSNHKLFIADAHESHVVEKLKKWQTLRVLGGSALIAASVVLSVRMFWTDSQIENAMHINMEAEKVQVEENKPTEITQKTDHESLNRWHQECVSGNGPSCVKLLEMKTVFNLDAKYIDYYSKSACKAGVAGYCERTPASR